MSRPKFSDVAGVLDGWIPESEAGHFMRCPGCGGSIDCRDLSQVFAHEGPLPYSTDDQDQ
ncbi:hypothetical protein KQX62_17065 [Rhodopseudomonas palustris]|uniref:Uncharacterized protein n=1 Tax=Rhodopseudomonas palustris TaxID=1076 RepID=A0AAX3DUB5_RHOPL|nr:hypothetical protein [Rhodopseudomonas palustris]UYO38424.1 hypothetical protein KQX62_17065 [Rhodopseudomonas palustris]